MNSEAIEFARALLPRNHIYADWAASALPLPSEPTCFVPPHHAAGGTIEAARVAVRGFVEDSNHNHHIIFTSGTTASFETIANRLPWTSESAFVCHAHVHNSLLGLRGVALEKGARCYSFRTDEFKQLLEDKPGRFPKKSFVVFAYSAECNLTGSRYPLEWAALVKKFGILGYPPSHVITLVDTARLLASAPFSIDQHPDIDAFVFSLYKLSATYTGLGVLLIRDATLLHRLLQSTARGSYFAGGHSVKAISPFSNSLFVPSDTLTDVLQLGTPNMNAIHALPTQLAHFSHSVMASIEHLVRSIAHRFRCLLKEAFPSCVVHCDNVLRTSEGSGIVSVTFYREQDCTPVGHHEVDTILSINKVYARAGCMCNAGACASVLGLSDADLIRHYELGHRCGDEMDLVDGKPTGVVRVSFGWGSEISDADRIVNILRMYLVSNVLRPPTDVPHRTEKFVVTDLYTYPVKGCEGYAVRSLFCDGTGGALGDRVFGIEDRITGKLLDIRRCPELTRVSSSYENEWHTLVLSAPAPYCEALGLKQSVSIDVTGLAELRREQQIVRTILVDENIGGTCGWVSQIDEKRETVGNKAVQEWMSKVLGRPVRVVHLQAGLKRDKANVLITTKGELRELAEESRIPDDNILRSAIRPNVILERINENAGWIACTGEVKCAIRLNRLERFRNNRVLMERSRSCTRCQVVNVIAKAKGVEGRGEPLRSIARLSRVTSEKGIVFGSLARLVPLQDTVTTHTSRYDERLTNVLMNGDEVVGEYYRS
ncbi:Molybdenum cofactor sulfurase [Gracilariopsis chorda]|uniref:Molybdenum cofactor sulfurase n=1 Tax=Gracilariopsis chorda TaxID=448386 RepID=A0A2V3IFJ3_9FLOR|nr:Molybdenum cofactor sulfurase [Gracilariopsis chorda]|eukprot:PXF40822.1 Molybdenum cofactor sulfurase [Gracilariopsis chorda]